MNLAGKTAVVTGAAVRLGRAVALELAEHGADVAVHYGSHSDEAAAVVRTIQREYGRRAVAVQADLSDPVRAAAALFAAVNKEFGRADVLVNNAAIYEPGDFGAITEDHWDRHLGLNLKAPFFLAQRFAEQFDGDEGAIVNILCRRATRPTAEDLPYTAAKAGLAALTKGLALRLAPRIRVNGVAPGEMLPPTGRHTDPEEWDRQTAAHIPLRRVGGSVPVARAVRYLCEADFVTGETLHVTGGDHL
ncbi:SDR family oxidoreductase [Alienimonas californiensis]|uniref:SDR family oxidoreductase n=1 Tax=Alienimonas californiensis TaxID=2527989 RepID=UPI0013FCFD92|nr:SDR family oxidoreductase [Alienimonas californiensis]